MAFLEEKGVERLWQHTINKINEAVSGLDVQDEIYIGAGELPEGYTLQINPEGDAAVLPTIPSPSIDKAGQVIKVQADGTYGLAEDEAGISEVPADIVTAGTLAGQVQANADATAIVNVAQLRNISAGMEDLTAGSSALADGEVYLVYE